MSQQKDVGKSSLSILDFTVGFPAWTFYEVSLSDKVKLY